MSFAALLFPFTIPELRERYWGQRSLLLPRRADRFADLPFDFDALCASLAVTPAAQVKAQYRDLAGAHREMAISPAQLRDCFGAGMTVCIGDVDTHLPDLGREVAAWRRSLSLVGAMSFSGYWSPDGAGFGLHYDDRPVFICQIRGSKRWTYSRAPAVAEPRGNVIYTPESAARMREIGLRVDEPTDLESAVLEPGDMLYLPAGAWHATGAIGESLSLTLRMFDSAPINLARACLDGYFERAAEWRHPLPLVARSETLDVGAHHSIQRVLEARLADLQAFVSGLTVNDLERAWSIADARAVSTPLDAVAGLSPGDCLALRDDARIERAMGEEGEPCFRVVTAAREMDLPVGDNGWFETLIAVRRFTASDVSGWSEPPWPWDETRATLEELVSRGILQVIG